jgi:hypothetical protein
MRYARRGRHRQLEFASSGEDSFVAVVVTKLTGALLFILLLTMVIMALIPRAQEVGLGRDSTVASAAVPDPVAVDGSIAGTDNPSESSPASPLRILTPEQLPDAVAARPYHLALAAMGGKGPFRWSITGELPAGLSFDALSGRIEGVPASSSVDSTSLELAVSDNHTLARRTAHLQVLDAGTPLSPPTLRDWLERGFGYLILLLVWLHGINLVGSLERWSRTGREQGGAPGPAGRNRFWVYRVILTLAAMGSAAVLAGWLARSGT